MESNNFFEKILYNNGVLAIVFDRDIERDGEHSIEKLKNYSLGFNDDEWICMEKEAEEVLFVDKDYITIKLKNKIDNIYNLKIYGGNIKLKEVNYIKDECGVVCDFCQGSNVSLYENLLSIKEFYGETIDEYRIGLENRSELLSRQLEEEDFVLQVQDKIFKIASIEKINKKRFIFNFMEPIATSPRDKIILMTKTDLESKLSLDILGRPIMRGEFIEIKNTIRPNLKRISLVEERAREVVIDLDFEADIIRYSKGDFIVKSNGEKCKLKGQVDYLKKGEEVLIEVKNSFVDIFNPDIFVKKINGDKAFTMDYNYLKIRDCEFLKVESFIGEWGVFEKNEITIMWNKQMAKIEMELKDCEWSFFEEKSILDLKEIGRIVFIGERVLEEKRDISILERNGQLVMIFKDEFNIDRFEYIYYSPGPGIKDCRGIKALRTTTVAIEIIKNKINYIGPLEWGENFKYVGEYIYEDAVIEIDKVPEYRFYGERNIYTTFGKSLTIKANKDFLEKVKIDIFSFNCKELIIDLPINLELNFEDSIIESIERV